MIPLILIVTAHCAELSNLALMVDETEVNSVTSYQISFKPTSEVSADSMVQLEFPSDLTIADSANYPCTVSNLNGPPDNAYCSSSSNIVSVFNIFENNFTNFFFTLSVTLQDIQNPPSVRSTAPIQIRILSASLEVIDESLSSDALIISTTIATMLSASITPSEDVLGKETVWTFKFESKYTIPAGSQIEIAMPYWNEYIGADSTKLRHFIRTANPTCAPGSNIGVVSCSYDSADIRRVLLVTGGFVGDTSGEVSFTVSDVFNPPSPSAVGGFEFSISDSASRKMESLSGVSVLVSSPNSIGTIDSLIENSTVSQTTTYYLSFTVTNPLHDQCKVRVSFPVEINVEDSLTVEGNSNIQRALTFQKEDAQTVLIENGYDDYLLPTSSIVIKFVSITNPSSTKPSGNFTITTLTSNLSPIDTGTGNPITATPGDILEFNSETIIQAENYLVAQETTYTFNFATQNSIPSGGVLRVVFPSAIAVNPRNGSCTDVVGLDSLANCEVNGQVLTITDAFRTEFAPGQISFTVNQVTNSVSAIESESFVITSYADSSLDGKIDEKASGLTITAIPSPFKSVSISTDSQVTGVLSTFTFQVEVENPITQNGYLTGVVPNGMTVNGDNCGLISGFQTSGLECSFTQNSFQVKGFQLGNFDSGILEFTISFISNPPSTKSIGSFVLTSYDSSDNKIDETSSGLFIQVTEANTLQDVTVALASPINGIETTYTFTITPNNPLDNGYQIHITPPAEVEFKGNPSCSPHNCLVESSILKLTLVLSSSLTSEFSVSANPVKNPPSTKETGTFSVYTFTEDNFSIDKKEDGITVQTTEAAPISNMFIVAQDSLIGVTTPYDISFNNENIYPAGSKMTIAIPPELGITIVSCSSQSLDSAFQCIQTSNQLEISDGFSSDFPEGSVIDISLSPLTNPNSNESSSSPWLISINIDSYLIDKSDDKTSSFTCQVPCGTCDTIATFCTSCGNLFPYLYNNTCNTECPAGQTDPISTAETVCEDCSNVCVECEDAIDACTKCEAPLPYLYDQSCHSACKETQYGDGTNCFECVNPCLTCADASTCESCTTLTGTSTPTFLLNSACVTACNTQGLYENSVSFTCEPCEDPCVNCSTSASYCTECTGNQKVLEGNCVDACPDDGRYIDINNVCQKCNAPCDQCDTALSNCISCLDGYFLHGFECLDACPNGTYQGVSKCFDCESPCEWCSLGTTICDTCEVGYLLEGSTCVVTCSSGFLSNGEVCQPCTSPCQTCSGTVTGCDSCIDGLFALNKGCVSECPSGTHIPLNNVCVACEDSCATCAGSPSNCQSCSYPKVLHDNSCIDSCPANVTIETNGECKDCNSNCAECAGDVNTCTACSSPLLLQDGECIATCSVGFVTDGQECLPCNASCFDCEGATNQCTVCPQNSYLYENSCVANCPSGFTTSGGSCIQESTDCSVGCTAEMFSNDECDALCDVESCFYDNYNCTGPVACGNTQYESGGSCFPCVYPCNNCRSQSTCLSCGISTVTQKVLLLYDDYCYDDCPSGTYKDGFVCQDCFTNCAECDGPDNNQCTSCDSPYYLYNFQCITACPFETSVLVDGVCYDCDSNCATCSGTLQNCTSCADGKVLQDDKCRVTCNSGYTSINSVCKACVGCAECENLTTQCTECASSLFLYNQTCVSECPQGTYPAGNECKTCQVSCVICAGENNCSVCAADYYKYGSLCLSSCPAGFSPSVGTCVEDSSPGCAADCTVDLLFNSSCDTVCNTVACNYDNQSCVSPESCSQGEFFSVDKCEPCIYPCSVCTSSTDCTACQTEASSGSPQYLYQGTCVLSCPSGTLLISPSCVDCDSSCSECASTIDTCSSCPTGEFLYQGNCLDECPPGDTVALNNICEPCVSTCLTCEGSIDNCTSCDTGLVLDGTECIADCNDGFSISSSDKLTCQPCTNNCATCSDEPSLCDSCDPSYKLFQRGCYTECPSGLSLEIDGQCEACQAPCQTCVTSLTTCTSCVNDRSLLNYECLTSCPNGFENRLGICEAFCADGCPMSLLYNGQCEAKCNTETCAFDDGDCVRHACSKNQYLEERTCTDCSAECSSCDTDGCLSCNMQNEIQMLLYQGNCYQQCPSGTFKDGAICKECSSTCKECSGATDHCTECTGSVLFEHTCIVSCPANTTIEKDGVCLSCEYPCAECSGETDFCTQCYDNAFVTAGVCVNECDTGEFKVNGSCQSCDPQCLQCSGDASTCVRCPDGSFLHQGTCISDCPEGFAVDKASPEVCTACSSVCDNCADSIFFCSSCEEPLGLTSSLTCQETSTCPADFLGSGSSCLPCDSPCGSCSPTIQTCVDCAEGYILLDDSCQECDSVCRTCEVSLDNCTGCYDGEFLSGATCQECQEPCKNCVDSADKCLSCIGGYLLSGNTCEACLSPGCWVCDPVDICSECIPGYFLNGTVCQECSSNCSTCESSSAQCTSCASGQYLTSANVCGECDENCLECSGSADNCTECQTGEVLLDNVCGVCKAECLTCTGDFDTCGTCETGLELLNGSCGICSSNCLTCTGNFDTCGSCASGQVLVSGECLECDATCVTCSVSPTSCTACRSGVLLGGACLAQCPDGYFENNKACELCTSPCKTCTAAGCTSCITGYELSGSNCILDCGDAQYLSDGTCYNCSDNCLTCQDSAERCTSCSGGLELSDDWVCRTPCESGFTRIDGVCQACSGLCSECSGETSYCTACTESSQALYEGNCLEDCPVGVTVLVTGVCKPCESPCFTCSDTPISCTSCVAGQLLFETTCVDTCPQGYEAIDGLCCKDGICEDLEDDSFDSGPVPFPFSSLACAGAGIIGLTKAVASTVSFFPATISIWAVAATVSWLSLMILIPVSDGEDLRRRLVEIDIAGDPAMSIALILIIGALSFHFVCNLGFLYKFCKKIYKEDKLFLNWRSKHRIVNWIMLILTGGISFHCVRLAISRLCNKNAFDAGMEYKPVLLKLLVFFGYISILCTCLPLLSAQILLLTSVNISNWLWMFSLDSLILTLIFVALLIFDTIKMEKAMILVKERLLHPVNEFARKFSTIDFNEFDLFNEPQIARSKSKPPSQCESPMPAPLLRRKNSFPLENIVACSYTVDAESLRTALQGLKDSSWLDATTFIAENDSIFSRKREFKNKRPSLTEPHYKPTEDQPSVHFEIVAYTEEPEDIPKVDREEEMELDLAFADPYDPEIINVYHKPTGKRVRVRKGFRGARIVDLEGKVIEGVPPIDPINYLIPSATVDEQDVRFATLMSREGGKVRVKRSFKGASILKLEQKAQALTSMIGQAVKSESEFAFDTAYADGGDPESVIVIHKDTGEEFRIRKTFEGALPVDSQGMPIAGAKGIERIDYDISKTIVDPGDVHLATLSRRDQTGYLRVRRDFRGARIIDLEKKTQQASEVTLDFSQKSLEANKTGWIGDSQGIPQGRERLANLASVISTYEEINMPPLEPEHRPSSRQLYKKPIYQNLDLEDVYGESLHVVDLEDPYPPRKAKKKRDGNKVKDLEHIYLTRLPINDSGRQRLNSTVDRPATMTGSRKFSTFGEEIIKKK